MFTGLIQELGRILSAPPRIRIQSNLAAVLVPGDSIAVNGACLTVTRLAGNSFYADVMPETLRRTTLGLLRPGSWVNLETALTAGAALGGHLVSGHIDEKGIIHSVVTEHNATIYDISCSEMFASLLAEKGSVAVDGISLTIVSVDSRKFSVSVIPHTRKNTTLSKTGKGDAVNLECDSIARYVREQIIVSKENSSKKSSLMEALERNGFTGE